MRQERRSNRKTKTKKEIRRGKGMKAKSELARTRQAKLINSSE